MSKMPVLLRRTVLIGLCLTALRVQAAAPDEEASIRKVMMGIWDKPEAHLIVGPVVIVDRHAIAGWTQAARGGRAVLHRSDSGEWQVAASGGDGIKDVATLVSAGIPDSAAKQLATALQVQEGTQPTERLAKFASFDGFMRMGAQGHDSHAQAQSTNE